MSAPDRKLFFPQALTRAGWQDDVVIAVSGGRITDLTSGTAPPPEAIRYPGTALPGIGNLHSHAFQRGMAGLAERGGPRDDHFWSWREVMYRFLGVLTPEDIEAITALAFMEMLEAGFTAVAEFHYLHNDIDGGGYAAPGELAERVAAAAEATGIGLLLLPVFYAHAGFGGAPPSHGQRRFINSLDSYATLLDASRSAIRPLANARLGVAPHSLRAVTVDELTRLGELAGDAIRHIHAAEQEREVEDCLAATGARPIEWLLDHAPLGPRWCVVHATQIDAAETAALARSGAVAGLCPITEANLGDGIFPAVDYVAAGGRLGIGTDSNVSISVAHELRGLEYSQRLRDRARNRLAPPNASTGRRLFDLAAAGGAQALDGLCGDLAPGERADILVLDPAHPGLVGRSRDSLIDSWIFAVQDGGLSHVLIGGEPVVVDGRHVARAPILARWIATAAKLRAAL